jgi:hypothetical protein
MLNKKVFVSLILLSGLVQTGLQAQDATTATGGNATGANGTLTYSVGQIVYTTNKGVNGSMNQGVQYPYEISVVSGLEDTKSITLEYSVYPNPTADYLKLKITDYKIENLSYQLYDTNGKLILSQKINEAESTVSLQGFIHGSYFLKLTNKANLIKTFKIIKQ